MGHFIMFAPHVNMLDGYWAKQSSEELKASWTSYLKVIGMHEYKPLQGIIYIPTICNFYQNQPLL
jgi:hypothetical protein